MVVQKKTPSASYGVLPCYSTLSVPTSRHSRWETRPRLGSRAMGVTGLLKYFKEVVSKRIWLTDQPWSCCGRRTFRATKGGFENRNSSTSRVAHDVVPLVMEVAGRLRCFSSAGWNTTVVFDGDSSPAKSRTAQSRSSTRTQALELCHQLRLNLPERRNEFDQRRPRRRCPSPLSVARVPRALLHVLPCNCIASP